MRRKFSYNFQIIIFSFFLLLLIDIFLILIGINNIKNSNIFLAIADVVLLIVAYPVLKIFARFTKGEDGELDVRNVLEKLPGGYFYLQDIMFPNSKINIDFAVIGQTGIWAIEVKNYKKKQIVLDYSLKKNIRQAKMEAESLQRFLNLPVNPILVFTNKKTKINFGMRPINGVYVIGKSWLEELLTKHQKGYLSPEKCQQIKEELKKYTSRIN